MARTPSVGSMRPARLWGVYLLLVFAGGALLAPWVYRIAQAVAGAFPAFEGLAGSPFHRYVNRCLLVLALAGLWPLLRALGFRSWRDLGLAGDAQAWKRWGLGVLLGLGSLALVATAGFAAGARDWAVDRTTSDMVRHLLNAGGAAVVVSVVEEVLFRGGLFGSLRRRQRLVWAVLLSSAVYAWVHFLARVKWEAPVNWSSGIIVLGQMSAGLFEWRALIPGFLNLLLAGAILAWGFERTGTLYFSIGLHAGWIFWLKSYGFVTRHAAGHSEWFWGTNKLIDGWASLPVLLLTAWAMTACTRGRVREAS